MRHAMRDGLRRLPSASRAVVLLALGLVGLGSWWWLSEQRDAIGTVDAPREPDSYFRGLDLVRHDAEGSPEMRVTADYAEHYEDETWVHLRELKVRGLAAGPAWQLTADNGRLTDDGVQLNAWGNVVLTRTGDADDQMQLRTAELFVNTDTELATTDAAVVISQGGARITGRGMRASLANDHLQIQSEVEARYEK